MLLHFQVFRKLNPRAWNLITNHVQAMIWKMLYNRTKILRSKAFRLFINVEPNFSNSHIYIAIKVIKGNGVSINKNESTKESKILWKSELLIIILNKFSPYGFLEKYSEKPLLQNWTLLNCLQRKAANLSETRWRNVECTLFMYKSTTIDFIQV